MNGKVDQTNKRRSGLSCFPPGEGAVLAAVIANLLANGLDAAQIAVLAAFVTTIGDSPRLHFRTDGSQSRANRKWQQSRSCGHRNFTGTAAIRESFCYTDVYYAMTSRPRMHAITETKNAPRLLTESKK